MAFAKGHKLSGCRKGKPNATTKALKEMILGALDGVGGQAYLQRQAEENPTAFMTLIGKVLPMTVVGPGEDGAHIVTIHRRFTDAASADHR